MDSFFAATVIEPGPPTSQVSALFITPWPLNPTKAGMLTIPSLAHLVHFAPFAVELHLLYLYRT